MHKVAEDCGGDEAQHPRVALCVSALERFEGAVDLPALGADQRNIECRDFRVVCDQLGQRG
jgi:hypothetical protein